MSGDWLAMGAVAALAAAGAVRRGSRSHGFHFALEMLCADQGWGEIHPAWQETLDAQALLEELAPDYGIGVNVIRSPDKYSDHQDAYLYFDFDELPAAKRLADEAGLPGDILDLRVDSLSPGQIAEAKAFAIEAGWTLGHGW
jgi:hypothetical protein